MSKTVGVVLTLKDRFSTPLKDMANKLGKTEKELKKANLEIKRFQDNTLKSFKRGAIVAGAGVAAITAGVVSMGLSWARLASDAEETNNKISVVFGNSSNVLQNWAKTSINKMGLAGQSALDSAALFGDMARGMGISEQKSASMAMTLTQLSADLASFKNIRQDVAKTALNGVFSGETESLKQLGIVMTQANLEEYAHAKGIKKKIKDMKEAEKVQLRYNYVLEKTKLAQGDFERTGGGAANQERMFEELKTQIGGNLGKVVLPTFTKTLKTVNSLLVQNMPLIQSVVTNVFNSISNAIKLVSNNLYWIIPIATGVLTAFLAFKTITGVIAVFNTLKTVITAINAVQGVWNALLLANPIGLIAVGIGVAIGAIALLVMNWDKVTNALKRAWEWIVKVAQGLLGIKSTNVNVSTSGSKPVKKHNALGTNYFSGGLTHINEGGRGEIVNLPNGSQVIPHNLSKQAIGGGKTIKVDVNIQGDFIGTREFLNKIKSELAIELTHAMAKANN